MSGIPSWAVRGAKVAWVGEGKLNLHPVFHPSNGEVFTIAEAHPGAFDDMPLLVVSEMRNADCSGPFWKIDRFRPLTSQQDDIETHFKALLDVPEQVGA